MDCYIRQIGNKDCAFASLKMLLAYYSKNKEFLFLDQDLTKTDYSLWDIVEIAKRNGVILQGIKINDLNINFKIEKEPFLALLKNDDGTTHMVFVRKVYKRKLLIFDPKNGKYKLSIKEFNDIFTGIYLKVNFVDNIKNFKSRESIVVNKTGVALLCVFKSISSIFLMLGFYFMNENAYFIVPLALVATFIICSMFSNLLVKKVSSNFDKKISNLIYKKENKKFEDNYTSILKYKTMMFNAPISIVSNFLVSLFFIVISIMNDINCIFTFSLIMILSLLDYFIFKAVKAKYSIKMEVLESGLARFDIDKPTFVSKYKELSNVGSSFSSFLLLRKYLIGFIIFCISFVLMALEGKISLNFLIFNYLVLDIVFQSFDKILSFADVNEEFKQAKAKFVSLITPSK